MSFVLQLVDAVGACRVHHARQILVGLLLGALYLAHLWRINVKSKVKGAKVKEAEVLVNKATYAPAQLRIRFGLIWATITLSNFKAANYDDSNFHFDPHKYPGVKIVDKR